MPGYPGLVIPEMALLLGVDDAEEVAVAVALAGRVRVTLVVVVVGFTASFRFEVARR